LGAAALLSVVVVVVVSSVVVGSVVASCARAPEAQISPITAGSTSPPARNAFFT
jgi:hypothetical protein